MLTMAEKIFLGLAISLSIVFAGILVLPAFSFEVSLVTSPNRETFFVPAGKPFNITCKGSGDDADKFSSLKWLNEKGQIISQGIPGTQEVEKNSLTLMFTDPKEDDSGVYKCIATYDRDYLQKTVSIVFHGSKPSFKDSFQRVTATTDSILEIECSADGDYPIIYEWLTEDDTKITRNSNSSIYVSDIANASVLVIPRVTVDHAGLYTCLASNTHGLSSAIFELVVKTENGNDTTNGTASFGNALVVNVTATSVKFALNVTGPVIDIEVQYYEDRNRTEYLKTFKYGEDYEIKELIPAGRYYFKFRTIPSANNQWSNLYKAVLLPDKPEVIFRTVNSGTVKIEWLFKFEDRMRKTIDRHEISYFTVVMVGGTSWKPNQCAITIEIPECTSSFYTISGLSENVYYEIQVRAHTAAGYGEPYTQKIFMPRTFTH